jgi:hypothetical protein
MPNEQRLDQLRDEAWGKGIVAARGVDVAGGPIPRQIGYYGQPILKPPVWTWEIPVYFFIGGIAGMSALIALASALFHHLDVARMSILLAAIGATVSPALLTMDLGRPRLFLNMLRVFKYKSVMSIGAWLLTFFGACALPALLALELHARHVFPGDLDHLIRLIAAALILAAAALGLLLATYTGVLLGATAIPAWYLHRILLPIHFGTAGLGSAAALLELLGYRIAPLNAIGFLAAATESALWIWLELDKHGAPDRALYQGRAGWLIRGGEMLSGTLALLLRAFGFIPMAALSFLLGALLSRFGWVAAGKVCACDAEAVLAAQR